MTTKKAVSQLNAGSTWSRWEPHIHAPGTLFNNQFTGADPWSDYLTELETSSPTIRALAVTDYYLTGTYERVLKEKAAGRLNDIDLIFPNVEMRLDVGTQKGRFINIHLLVSPEDPEHLAQLSRILARLSFRAHKDTFACTSADLARLGRASDPAIIDEAAALRHGAEQFKVSFNQLREVFDQSNWAKENICVAVAGSQNDGTSGVREASDATLRQEMEQFADVIFASSPAQREFWLGLRDLSELEIRTRYRGLKPCLHGSDAHAPGTVGKPDGQRYSWIKGAVEFEALRQACIDPAGRAYVGTAPPETGTPSQVIDRIRINNAAWAATPDIALNPGLVAVIGARGSGKTALADIIALACDAIPFASAEDDSRPSSSFLQRAHNLLGSSSVQLFWKSGDPITRSLDRSTTPDVTYPRARYLSQQFVEDLCSAKGMTDALLREIERVIFEAHPVNDRDGAIDFAELLELRASRFRLNREREETAIIQLSERIGTEFEKDRLVDELKTQVAKKKAQIDGYTSDRAKLVTAGSEDRLLRLTALTTAAEKVRGFIRYFNSREQALLALQDQVKDQRSNQAPEQLRKTQEVHFAASLKADQWKCFLLDYTGDVDTQLTSELGLSRKSIVEWKGAKPKAGATPETPLIAADAPLERLPLALLEGEIERLQKLVSADANTQKQFAALSKRIVTESALLETMQNKLTDAQGAKGRAQQLQIERDAGYKRIFEAITSEQQVLIELYKPLMERLKSASGTLQKLNFTVSRAVDIQSWASVAEKELVDLRRQGPFRGKGNFQAIAEDSFRKAWETGDAQAAAAAMTSFRNQYQNDLLEHSLVSNANQPEYRAWLKQFAHWLFSTDHIQLQYGIDYDGIDIRKLSPGSRGIVLLLLYLALDDSDDRPLIIDQPEENLDPKSVFDELVGLFVAAKSKRQVIMVTHNANLVINTDADQIIVAEAGHHARGELPRITYTSGGLENAAIRKTVVDILEGGEQAFRERARRLRVRFGK